jgi:hypothetical protein
VCLNLGVWTQLLVSGLERQRGKKFEWNQWHTTNRTLGNHGRDVNMKNLGQESATAA